MSYEEKDPKGTKELLDGSGGWTFVDVRTVEEFDQGHVPGAYNVPILFRGAFGMSPNADFLDVVKRLFPKDAKLVFG